MFISRDMLPGNMELNAGDILEFKVVGQDADGQVEVEYNHGDDGDEGEDSGEANWKTDLKSSMEGSQMKAGPGDSAY